MSKRRIVVTGLGVVSPVGSTVKAAWDAILRGESGIGPVTRFDVSAFPVRIGGAVRDFDVSQYISPKDARRMGRSEEGRGGEEGRCRWVPHHFKKKKRQIKGVNIEDE